MMLPDIFQNQPVYTRLDKGARMTSDVATLERMRGLFSMVRGIPEGKGSFSRGERQYDVKLDPGPFKAGDNACIITGSGSDLIVLDIDDTGVFLPLAEANAFDWEENFVVQTGKGIHIYYRWNADLFDHFQGAKKVSMANDTLGAELLLNWLCQAPGSVVDQTINNVKTGVLKQYRVVADGPIQEIPPKWIMSFILKAFQEAEQDKINKEYRSKQLYGDEDDSWKTAEWDLERTWRVFMRNFNPSSNRGERTVNANKCGVLFGAHNCGLEALSEAAGRYCEITSKPYRTVMYQMERGYKFGQSLR